MELVQCHSEATRGRSPVSPDRPTKIVLRRSVGSAQYARKPVSRHPAGCRHHPIDEPQGELLGQCADGELLFGTLKTELVHHREYPDRDTARRDLFAYIEGYYNRARIHSAIGYITPQQAEAKAA
jgi:putative transposase